MANALPGEPASKYGEWYFALISAAQFRPIAAGAYYERHHILPKSLYPESANDRTNIVPLTAREHFICHWLLTKMVSGTRRREQMLNAFGKMMDGRKSAIAGWRYEECRKAHAIRNKTFMSRLHKGKEITPAHRAKISAARKGVARSEETRRRISAAKVGVAVPLDVRRKLSEATRKYAAIHGGSSRGIRWSPESRIRLKAKFRDKGHPCDGKVFPKEPCPDCGRLIALKFHNRHMSSAKCQPKENRL